MTDTFGANEGASSADASLPRITAGTLEALRGTKGWVKLAGILLMVCAAFTLLGIFAVVGMGAVAGRGSGMPLAAALAMSLFYVAFAALYFFLGQHLLRYSRAINLLLSDTEAKNLEDALESQRKFWRLAGVMMFIGIAFAVLGIIAAVVIPFMAR